MRNLNLLDKYTEKYKKIESIFLPDFDQVHKTAWAPARPKVLLLDIDETMIHCIDDRDPPTMRGTVNLVVKTESAIEIAINLRPGLLESLKALSK